VRFTALIVGFGGFFMVHILNALASCAELRFWWMHAMVFVWLMCTLMLFVVEPLVLRKRAAKNIQRDHEKAFAVAHRMHWVLLSLSLITIAGAVAGSHGWMLQGE